MLQRINHKKHISAKIFKCKYPVNSHDIQGDLCINMIK